MEVAGGRGNDAWNTRYGREAGPGNGWSDGELDSRARRGYVGSDGVNNVPS